MTNSSNRVTIVIAAVLLVVVTAVGVASYTLGRSTATPPPLTSPSIASADPTASETRPAPSYSPTDPNGSPEPGLPRGDAIAGKGGSKTGPAGLPLGYTHDETGAVNAATNYLMWMNSTRIADKNLADQMAAAAAANPATRTALTESFDMLRTGLEGIKEEHMEPARGAYAVAEFSGANATVYIWSPMVMTDTSGMRSDLWSINSVKLNWSGDWKLSAGLVDRVGAAAVYPLQPTGNPTLEEKHSILRRTPADSGEINDSADQSWFEYANAPH